MNRLAVEIPAMLLNYRDGDLESIIVDGAIYVNTASNNQSCEVVDSIFYDAQPTSYYEHTLSCGHTVPWDDIQPPLYCPECGSRVIS